MSQRNLKLFLNTKAEIERIGVDKVASFGTLTRPTIYSFLSGSQGLSLQAEESLLSAVDLAKKAESEELLKIDEKWEKVVSA